MKSIKGHKHSKETKDKLSRIAKARFTCPENHPMWGGGETTQGGYIKIRISGHPYAHRDGYVFKHRYVMEQNIGRYLNKNEVVHHKDGNLENNDITNLQLFEECGSHIRFHKELRHSNVT